MWIVRLALRRPYTVGVMALLIMMMGILSIKSMLIDIFPVIDIPVVIVVWNYNGLSANEMEKKVTACPNSMEPSVQTRNRSRRDNLSRARSIFPTQEKAAHRQATKIESNGTPPHTPI